MNVTSIEYSLIGSLLFKPTIFFTVDEKLPPSPWFNTECAKLYDAMLECMKEDHNYDIPKVSYKSGVSLQSIQAYIKAAEINKVDDQIAIIKEAWYERQLVNKCHGIISSYSSKRVDSERKSGYSLYAELRSEMDLAFDQININAQTTSKRVLDIMKNVDQNKYSRQSFYDKGLDIATGGLIATDMGVIGARPGVGKTTMGLTIVRKFCKAGIPVGFISTEMSADMLLILLICSEAGLKLDDIYKEDAEEGHKEQFAAAAMNVGEWPLNIDDESLSWSDIHAKMLHWNHSEGTKVWLLDYLQNVEANKNNATETVAFVSRSIKKFAKKHRTPIIALAQCNRSLEQQGGRQPKVSDLKQSGQIEQDADWILLLHNPDPNSDVMGGAKYNMLLIPGKTRLKKSGADLYYVRKSHHFEYHNPQFDFDKPNLGPSSQSYEDVTQGDKYMDRVPDKDMPF